MRIVVLTGAGISAESGVPTFRDSGGLWEGHDVEDVATPEGYERDPDTVLRFYDARRRAAASVTPNAAHRALARLEGAIGEDLLVVTQNVDDLHERAGSRSLVHMHGELRRALCTTCGARPEWDADLIDRPPCPACGAAHPAPRRRVVRRDAVRTRPHRAGGASRATSSSRSARPARCIRLPGYVALAAAFGARTRRAEPRAQRRADSLRRGPQRARERARARMGRRDHRRRGNDEAPGRRIRPALSSRVLLGA